MVIIKILLFIIFVTLALSAYSSFSKQILSQLKIGCLSPFIFLILSLLSIFITDIQFYPKGSPLAPRIWNSLCVWYEVLTFFVLVVFLKYFLYLVIKLNIFGNTKSKINIKPIEINFKGIIILIAEIISLVVSIWKIINILISRT